jgi:hypothetical protein
VKSAHLKTREVSRPNVSVVCDVTVCCSKEFVRCMLSDHCSDSAAIHWCFSEEVEVVVLSGFCHPTISYSGYSGCYMHVVQGRDNIFHSEDMKVYYVGSI